MGDDLVDYKIAVGQSVKHRLLQEPDVLQIPSDKLDLFVARDFLTPDQCAGFMAMIDAGSIPSQLLAPTPDPEFRTSASCNVDPCHPLVIRLEIKLAGLLGIRSDHGETIQGQRYAVGQQFKPHHDFFHTDQPYWPQLERSGGQRTWTAMIFLNAPEAGGETAFPEAGLKIAPRAGSLLAWNNLDAFGRPNGWTLHQGCPVVAGTKYIITKWYRERTWVGTELPTY